MSDFDSGNSVNCVLLDINLYETKRENNWSPIPEGTLDYRQAFEIARINQRIQTVIRDYIILMLQAEFHVYEQQFEITSYNQR